jgi:hypothetical protein
MIWRKGRSPGCGSGDWLFPLVRQHLKRKKLSVGDRRQREDRWGIYTNESGVMPVRDL